MTLHMEPLAAPPPDAVLVGDPRRAFALAQALTDEPRMTHIARGLWGYLGRFGSGSLTVQSTGAGGGPAAVVVTDLAAQGVGRMVRLGTCEAVDPNLELGTVLVVRRAIGEDGASACLTGSQGSVLEPDPLLTAGLTGAGPPVEVTSRDLVGRIDPGPDPASPVRDLQTAAFLAAASGSGVAAATILVVAGNGAGRRLPEKGIEGSLSALGPLLHDVLGRPARSNPKP